MTGEQIIDLLALEPLPHEGGMWAQTWIDAESSAIYFLMRPGDFSAMHRLTGVEIWHHYAGTAARMLLLHPDGTVTTPVLGDDLSAGQRPTVVVRPGVWMGATTMGDWTLVGTTMAPPYSPESFELGDRATLAAAYPEAAHDIVALTRVDT